MEARRHRQERAFYKTDTKKKQFDEDASTAQARQSLLKMNDCQCDLRCPNRPEVLECALIWSGRSSADASCDVGNSEEPDVSPTNLQPQRSLCSILGEPGMFELS
eukprot:2087844-Amphidinium_carterae.1